MEEHTKSEKAIGNMLISIRSHIPYETFTIIDDLIRKRMKITSDILAIVNSPDGDNLYNAEENYIQELVRALQLKYETFSPCKYDFNYVNLIPGSKYIMNMKVTPDWSYVDKHPFVYENEVKYIGRDLSYKYDESHIFQLNKQCFDLYDKLATKDDVDALIYMTNICSSRFHRKEKLWYIHICPNKYTIRNVTL
jgi:hypothetical protein